MVLVTERLAVNTRGDDHVVDLTAGVQDLVSRHRLREGQALVFVSGSTAGVTTIEYEPGLLEDLPAALERLAPRAAGYRHHERWGDDNGHAHVRASLLGPSVVIPVVDGRLAVGTWQQVVLVDSDTRPRQREILVQLSGRG
jgi:secondary thiamine-phosphate synthase enzyme